MDIGLCLRYTLGSLIYIVLFVLLQSLSHISSPESEGESILVRFQCAFTPRRTSLQAILLEGAQHDCDINNVIIFSGRVGVNSSNGANRIQGIRP